MGPYTAINWVFESEDAAIILEDDCLPSLSFFDYCGELLGITPTKNLINYIGFEGTHSFGYRRTEPKFHDDFKINKEPLFVLPQKDYELYHFKKHTNRRKFLIYRIIILLLTPSRLKATLKRKMQIK